MKLTKLGIEWGAAFEQAQPILITSSGGTVVVVIYEREDGNLVIDTFDAIKLERLTQRSKDGDLRVIIGN